MALAWFNRYARAATLITDVLRIALILITDSCYWNLASLRLNFDAALLCDFDSLWCILPPLEVEKPTTETHYVITNYPT